MAIFAQRAFTAFRPGGVRVLAGAPVIEHGMVEEDFKELAAAGVNILGEIGLGSVKDGATAHFPGGSGRGCLGWLDHLIHYRRHLMECQSQFARYTFLMPSTSSHRPRLTRKGAETRARIVDAAAELIFRQGVAGTTVEEVRDGAHVSSSQLYHYFDESRRWFARSSSARPT